MEATETYIGSEPRFAARIGEKESREMQDVLARCLPSFYRKAYRHLGNAADAEDAVQDALLAAYKHLDQFRGQSQMSTWLTSIVINCARMHLRKRPRQTHLSLDERFGEDEEYSLAERLAYRGPSPEDTCRKSELDTRVLKFAAQLSTPLRKAFQLHDVDGLSTGETARLLGVPDGTVKARVSRARAKLRRLMCRSSDVQPRSASPRAASR